MTAISDEKANDRLKAQSEQQKQKKAKWMDISTAIVLAVASVLSAWFSYQSGQWNSKQSFYLDDENIADNNRLQKELTAAQRRAGDGAFIINLITAQMSGNKKLEQQLYDWFPPHLKKAYFAWKSMDTLKGDSAYSTPLHIKEYVIPELIEAKQFASEAAKWKKLANEADSISSAYLRLSIMIAMVLFFTGLAGITESLLNQRILLIFALALLVLVILSSLRYPILVDF